MLAALALGLEFRHPMLHQVQFQRMAGWIVISRECGEIERTFGHARRGQVKDLGGNVFKKRLAGNLYRAILLGPGRKRWFFVYLYAKQNHANISADELRAFRKLANEFGNMTETELTLAQEYGDLLELTHGH